MSTRLSFRVATAVALVFSALALTPLGASAGPAGTRTSSSLRSPAWMRDASIRATAPVGGAVTEAELPGASNPSEPYAAASQAVQVTPLGQPTPIWRAPSTAVNWGTGDWAISVGDLWLRERGVPLGLSLTYNSYFASKDSPFGRGWSFNVGMSLAQAADGSVTITQENGSRVTFQQKGTHYVAPPRVIASLREVSGTFVFTRGTRNNTCSRLTRSCLKSFFREPGPSTPGRLTKLWSPDGSLSFTYAGRNLAAVKDPAGRTLSFTYTKGKVSTTALDADGGAGDHMTYDTKGNLTRFTNAGGGSYGFLYDAYHRLTRIVDPRGAETDIVYDSAGHVQSITDPAGETDFSRSPGQASVTRPGGLVSTAHFSQSEVTRIDEGNPAAPLATTLFTYDPATLGPTAMTDPDEHTSHMTYDALGHLTSYTDPLGHTSVYHFGQATGIIDATDPVGTVSRATTDSSGRLMSIAVDTGHPALTETTSFHYASHAHSGDVTSVTDAEGHVWHFTYDSFGNQTSVSDPLGDTSTAAYDRMGRPAVNTLSNGNVAGADPNAFSTTYLYDPEGRMLSTTDPLGNTESFSYDAAGNLVSTLSGGHQTSYGYDFVGRWTVATRPNGSHATMSYLANGHVGEVCDDGNTCDDYTYDTLGRLVSVRDQLGNTTSYTYSAAGLLLSSTDANGVTTSYTHDADDQTTGVSYSDRVTHSLTHDFDRDGRLIGMTDGTGTSSFTYDSLGRLTNEINGSGATVDYAYDRLDHVIRIGLGSGSTVLANEAYDAAGRLIQLRDRFGNATSFTYDASSNLVETDFPGGAVDSNGYDNAGRLVNFTVAQGATIPVLPYTWRWNLQGQVTGATQPGLPDQTYAYDVNGRLAAVNGSAVKFDSRDNLLQDESGNSFTYDAADRLATEAATSSSGTTDWQFGYDADGSRTSASTLDGTQSKSSVWDAAGNLVSFSDGSTSETNTYDGLGRRVLYSSGGNTVLSVWGSTHTTPRPRAGGGETDKDCDGVIDCVVGKVTGVRVLNTASIANQGARPTGEPTGPLAEGGTTFLYGPDGLPVEQIDASGNALFYHHDQLGSTRAVTDRTGHTAVILSYDAFGNETYHSGTVSVPFGFDGAYTDPVSRLILFGGNYYDPSTGQFLTRTTKSGWDNYTPPRGSACKSTEVCGNGLADEAAAAGGPRVRIQWLEGYGSASCKSTEMCGNGFAQAVQCLAQEKVNRTAGEQCDSSYLGLQPLGGGILLGTSPYSFGGGDPVNATAYCRTYDGHTICGSTSPVTRSNISNN